MPRITKEDWTKWYEEKEWYAKRESQGFTADIEALEQHIKTLREVCPKDTAGYPHGTALDYLSQLQRKLDEAKRYLATVKG